MAKNITTIAEGDLQNKIYLIRGQKAMLDFDLAEIYGYETKYLNRQVQRNMEKFEGEEFMFQLTWEELQEILRCQNGTSRFDNNLRSKKLTLSWGGIRYLPYAFTEQGVYMLMTVLKGELATKQSRTLIRLFKGMKDYLINEQSAVAKIIDNTKDIYEIKTEIKKINAQIIDTVKKSEISPVFLDFAKTVEAKEFLLLEGKPIQAKEAYMEIYKHAKKKIYIIDNYISLKTLHLLQIVKKNLEVIIFTDNAYNYLRKLDLEDFKRERPDLDISFIKTYGAIHDRFIILDEKKVYLSGSSSKDAGAKMTSIHEITEKFMLNSLFAEIEKLKKNGFLKLR